MDSHIVVPCAVVPDSQEPPIATLEVWCRGRSTSGTYELHAWTRLRLGREEFPEEWRDSAISRDHLEFYVIHFDDSCPSHCYVRDRQSTNGVLVNGHAIGSHREITPGYLLQDGDEIVIPSNRIRESREIVPCLTFYFRQHASRPPASLTPIQAEEVKRFSDDIYVTGHLLGDGASGRVFLSVDTRGGVSKQITCKVMDIDTLNKPRVYDKYLHRWQQEIDVIRQLRHPNIIGFVHAASSPHNLYLFTELASGGDLFSFVQLVNGVAHLHAQGVVHRDLKPENILFAVRSSPMYRVVISDFGNCGFLSRRLKSMVGTEQYMSPEMHKRGESHDHLVDIWGLGTIMLFMINGHELTAVNGFPNMTQDEVYAKILRVCMESKARPGQAAQDFARRCCQVASRDRMTTPEAQTHSWFDDPRHLKLLDVVIRSCRNSWKPATGIYPPTDVLPDLSHLVTQSEGHESRTSEVISSAASGLTASQYFTNIDAEVPANLPTPPGIPIRLLQHEDLAVQDPNIEVPCTPYDEEYTGAKESQSQGFRPADVVHESQDIIPNSLPESIPMELQLGMRHQSMFM